MANVYDILKLSSNINNTSQNGPVDKAVILAALKTRRQEQDTQPTVTTPGFGPK